MTNRKPQSRPKPKGRKPASGVAALAAAQRAAAAQDDDDFLDGPDNDGTAPYADGYSVVAALADASLAQALRGRLRARLAAGHALAVVVAVPDPSFIGPIDDAVRRVAPTASVVARDGSLRSQHKPAVGGYDVGFALANGRAVVGVASAPEAVLPTALVSGADARLDLAPPSGAALRKLLRKLARGPVPRDVGQACASLTFDEVVSAFRAGATAREVLANFARAVASKASAGAADNTPPLDALPGFSGEARAWGEALVRDFARWRAGDLPWSALSSAAVLAGPPGTGKTMFARSLARSLRVPLVETSVGSWFTRGDGHLGDVTRALQDAWDAARASAPSVLFLDELDSLPDRASLSDRAREWWPPLLGRCLTLLSSDRQGTVLCAASNFVERTDAALLRRFERVLTVGLPTDADLAEVVAWHLGGALGPAALMPVVRLGAGATAARAAIWARDAAALAYADGRAVTLADVLAVVAPPDGRSLDDVRRAAVHEAGHAVAALATGRRVESASVVLSGASGGLTALGLAVSTTPTARQFEDAVVVALAGRAAEDVLLGAPSAAAESDLAAATAMVAAMSASAGLGGALVHLAPSVEAAALVRADPALRRTVERRLGRLYAEARTLVEARRDAVERVANALVRRRMLSGKEVAALAAGAAGRALPVARTGPRTAGGGHDQ